VIQYPLVSIITPCLNRAAFIEAAILSLRSQDYQPIEHIVIDGGSTDGTIDILKRYGDGLYWESDKGCGQAAALNRALSLVKGDIVGWLNSDDFYLPGAVRRAVEILEADATLDLFYGTCLLVDAQGRDIGMHATRSFSLRRLIWYDPGYFTIQAMFFRRRVLEAVGGFDTSLRYALDYDWMIRAGKACRVRYVPECLGAFRRHEDATQGRDHQRAYYREVTEVSHRHGGAWFAPIRYHIMKRLPGAMSLMRLLLPAKLALVRLGLAPSWL